MTDQRRPGPHADRCGGSRFPGGQRGFGAAIVRGALLCTGKPSRVREMPENTALRPPATQVRDFPEISSSSAPPDMGLSLLRLFEDPFQNASGARSSQFRRLTGGLRSSLNRGELHHKIILGAVTFNAQPWPAFCYKHRCRVEEAAGFRGGRKPVPRPGLPAGCTDQCGPAPRSPSCWWLP